MKLIIFILSLFMILNTSGMNLALRAQSLNCSGEINLINKETIWMNERAYLKIQVDQQDSSYLEEMNFNSEGGFEIVIQNLDGWNIFSLRADQNNFQKLDITSTYGLIDSPFDLYENGEFVTQLNCKAVWRRWD